MWIFWRRQGRNCGRFCPWAPPATGTLPINPFPPLRGIPIISTWRPTSHTVLYLTSLQLFDILEKNKFNKEDASTSNEQISYMLHSDLLIIDDLGTELVNSFTASQLFYFIEERHIRQRSTIISTNLSFQELRDRYSERIFSRFTGYYNFLMIVGEDIRIRKALR